MKKKQNNEPHAKRKTEPDKTLDFSKGWLKNGNSPGDPSQAPRCGAHSRRTGCPCRQPAMANGRCRLHGGKSTGPITQQGLAQSRKANWKHGESSQAAKAEQKKMNTTLKAVLAGLKEAQALLR